MKKLLRNLVASAAALAVIGALSGLLLGPTFIPPANAAATTQTLHMWLCAPIQAQTAPGPRRVVNSSSTVTPQPAYNLNQDGCASFANADAGYFLSQGYYFGPNEFVQQQMAITANTTAATSQLTLPAYAFIKWLVIEETAGNAVTGGVDIGDASSATFFASAVAVAANVTIVVVDSALLRLKSNSGVPVSDQILIVCHTACNSASLNVSVIYGYY